LTTDLFDRLILLRVIPPETDFVEDVREFSMWELRKKPWPPEADNNLGAGPPSAQSPDRDPAPSLPPRGSQK
jgi:hypothetical protein